MPMIEREYSDHRFEPDTVQLAYGRFKDLVSGQVPEERRSRVLTDGEWLRLSEAAEFFTTYTSDASSAELSISYKTSAFWFSVDATGTRVRVGLPLESDAMRVIGVFDAAAPVQDLRRSVFLGHGRHPSWSELANHLAAQPDLRVWTYENSITPGVTAIELLERIAGEVEFAVLVHTCDRQGDTNGAVTSNNVVHETGFFQGALGRHQTLVVRQRGCANFHNIAGLHEVTFDPESIRGCFEDTLRLIRHALLLEN